MSGDLGHRGKISPRAAGGAKTLHHPVLLDLPEPPMGIPRAAVSPCRVLQSIDWEGEQALLELTLVDARTVIGCHRTRGPEGRERWLIRAGEINSFPERCAEHGGPRSASAPTSSGSAFFSAFFRSCAAARSTGRGRHCIEFTVFLIQL